MAMRFEIELGGKARTVELSRADGQWRFATDGRQVKADAVEIAPGTFSIVIGGRVLEARVEGSTSELRIHIEGEEHSASLRDPRRWRRGDAARLESQGRQQVLAPMPGKIVRVLVKAGENIEVGQGIVVVEAMKMQNEVRSPKKGKIERIVVAEGQTVSAGQVVGIVA